MTDTALTLTLNDGRRIPQLGLGTYEIADEAAARAVREALVDGYRLIDTAAVYGNEKGVGEGVSGAADVFLTTKLWNGEHGAAKARAAFEASLKRLGRDSVDLLLIHWPCPKEGLYVETWRAMVEMRAEGIAKSIGVSNFLPHHLKAIADATGVAPAVNQIELHPYCRQSEAVEANAAHGTVTQCWSPLGRGAPFGDPALKRIAEEHGTSVPAVIIAWQVARGWSTIPKAGSTEHRRANLAALELTLSESDLAAVEALDRGEEGRIGPHPDRFGS